MSSGGGVELVIYSIAALISAIGDLRIACQKKTRLETSNGEIHNVDVLVTDDNGRSVGFQKQDDGTVKVIADSAGLDAVQLKKQQMFINRIKHRYAYNTVIDELKKQGYNIIEEKKLEKDTVKVVARRWA